MLSANVADILDLSVLKKRLGTRADQKFAIVRV
jgi:hypothetical protein